MRLAKNLQRASKFATMWNRDFLKRAFFNALLSQIDTRQEHTEKVLHMRSELDTRLKTRVLLAFRYHLLCINSQKMIRQKLDRMLLVKSLNALKYFTISQRIQTSFVVYRNNRTKRGMFAQWRSRYVSLKAQKVKMYPLLALLSKSNKEMAFKRWKKNSFRQKFITTL